MKQIYDILSGFKTLKEYTEFMEQLVEKSPSGSEVSRGMDKHDKSKEQKKQQVVSKEVKKNANGSSSEKHYDYIDPSVEQAPMTSPVPLQPGQQVNIGSKKIQDAALSPKTSEIKISGEQDSINTKPHMKPNPKANNM